MSELMYLFTKQIVTNSITIYVEILTEVKLMVCVYQLVIKYFSVGKRIEYT